MKRLQGFEKIAGSILQSLQGFHLPLSPWHISPVMETNFNPFIFSDLRHKTAFFFNFWHTTGNKLIATGKLSILPSSGRLHHKVDNIMKSITSLTPAAFQAFAAALPSLPDGDFRFAVMTGKTSGLPHTLWVSRPCGSSFKDLCDAVDGGEGVLGPNDRKLLSALWSDMNGLLPDTTRGGSFRISVNGKTGRISFALNGDVAPADGEEEEEV